MSQHDFNIANQGFPATRADINNAFQAIASNSSGPTAPSTTYANQWWYDTTNDKMYLRNAADSAWIEVAVIDQTNNEWKITSGVIQAVDGDGIVLKTDDGITRVTLDDSGNLLVGTTSANPTTGTDEGIALGLGGIILASNSSDAAMALNRVSTDGDIATFKKDGTVVGNIGVHSNTLTIGNGDTGLKTNADIDAITPHNISTNASRDNGIDLGYSSIRWKSLYLSTATYYGASGSSQFVVGKSASENRIWDRAGQAIAFLTSDTERMRVNTDGRISINNTSAINGGRLSIKFNHPADAGIVIQPTATTAKSIRFNNSGGTEVGSITASGSSTFYNTSSDYRLKENVTDVTDGITRIKQLAPKRFNFMSDPDTTVDGFIAHEAQAVVPEAVTGTQDAMRDEEYEVTAALGEVYTPAAEATFDDDGNELTAATDEVIHSTDIAQPETLADGQFWRETTAAVMGTRSVPDYQGIDQSKLVPLLTAALQEAIAKIEDLEARVAALESA